MFNYTQQLNLFTPSLPEWKNITIEWLFDYISSLYPEMKFACIEKEDYDGNKEIVIQQSIFKKANLEFSLGEYDECVDWVKNKNYIGCSTEKFFGNWGGMIETYDCMENFIESLPIRIQKFKETIIEYKEYIKQLKNKEKPGQIKNK